MRHVSWTEVPQTGKRKIIFKMVHRFLSETCFLTKFIEFILMIYGSKLRQGSARHVSFLCGMDGEHEVSLHGGWAGLEGPGWPHTHSMGSWHFGRRARKPGLSWTTLLFPMVSKPLSIVSPEVLGLLIWQLRAVRRSEVPGLEDLGLKIGTVSPPPCSIHQCHCRACPGLQGGDRDVTSH